MRSRKNLRRRTFLKTIGAGAPTLHLMGLVDSAAPAGASEAASSKFTPIDLGRHFTAGVEDFGSQERARRRGEGASFRDVSVRTPKGAQQFHGIPFLLGAAGAHEKSWLVLSAARAVWAARSVEIPLGSKAGYLCLAHFCDPDPNDSQAGVDTIENVGQRLADCVLIYEDGSERSIPLRRRFEVNPPAGRACFNAVPCLAPRMTKLDDKLATGWDWGRAQTGMARENLSQLWVCALENPDPDRKLKAVRLEAAAEDPLVICGLTLFREPENPLRRERRSLYCITLPSPTAEEKDRWKVDVDLGVVTRTYVLGDFQPEAWLKNEAAGLGECIQTREGSNATLR